MHVSFVIFDEERTECGAKIDTSFGQSCVWTAYETGININDIYYTRE